MHDRPRHVADQLEALVVSGMRVARINMCHGTRKWHWETIHRKRRLNEEKGYAVAIMMDTEESEIHTGDLGGASSAKAECLLCPGRDEKGVRSAKYYSWKDRRHAFHILEAKRKYVLELGIYFIPFCKVLQSWTLSV